MRIGIDLGGTKIAAIALDEQGLEVARRRIETPSDDYALTLEAMARLVESIEAEIEHSCTVGVGTPGALSTKTGLMKNANSTTLIDHALDTDLSQRLGRPIRIANDANCFTLSEAVDGAARDAHVVFGVILGTGVGGGIVIGGRVVTGVNAIAGEWGHNPLPWPEDDERPGVSCYCGKQGCIETFCSGPGLSRTYFESTGVQETPRGIATRAEAGEDAARTVLERYEHRLARSLASVVNLLDPDVVVLGGGVSNIARLYESVPRIWGRWIQSDSIATRLVQAEYGDASGVRGAAWLWSE